MIDRIPNYHGPAIRNNNDSDSTQNGIWAIFHHVIKQETLPLDEQHKFCTQIPDTWRKFWLDRLNGANTYFEKNRLDCVFKVELKPIFKRLACSELLGRCLNVSPKKEN